MLFVLALTLPLTLLPTIPTPTPTPTPAGVTSEGVNVFLDESLQAMGIDPRKDTFSVKITGGPDGDVAGNEILILNREYGDNVKVVGIADGTGVAEDPEGLDMKELLRLVAASEPISSFDRAKLGKDGVLMDVSTPEGVQRRNTMAFRVRATAFVPAGGRPATINESNYRDFLYEDEETGKTMPSSKLVVEGGKCGRGRARGAESGERERGGRFFVSLRCLSHCTALLCFALLCFALLCFALLCFCPDLPSLSLTPNQTKPNQTKSNQTKLQ